MASSPLLDRITPLIQTILRSPNVVPAQVTAKNVRKTLISEHGISEEEMNQEKKAVNERILSIFRDVFPDMAGDEPAPAEEAASSTKTPMKRQTDHVTSSIAPSSPAVPLVDQSKKTKRKRTPEEDNDEQVARKLHQALNEERSTRGSTSSGSRRKKATVTSDKDKKGRVKSKAYIDEDDDSGSAESGDEKADKKKKIKKKQSKSADGEGAGAKGGFSKPMMLSTELAEVLDETTLSRPQVVKKLWDYIKYHQLQKPENKRVIRCDEKLQKVFRVPEIDMFQMNKALSK